WRVLSDRCVRLSAARLCCRVLHVLPSLPTRRSSDLAHIEFLVGLRVDDVCGEPLDDARLRHGIIELIREPGRIDGRGIRGGRKRSEEHTSELQSRENLVCRLLLEKKNQPRHRTSRAT